MRLNDDGKTVAAYDLLVSGAAAARRGAAADARGRQVPGVGELVGGSQVVGGVERTDRRRSRYHQ